MDDQEYGEAQRVGPKESPDTGRGKSLDSVTVDLVVAEYNTLRDEILRASDRKIQLATITTIALGTLLATGIQFGNASLILVYPIFAAAVATLWAAEDTSIQTIGAYIQVKIEEELAGIEYLGWEHFVDRHPKILRSGYSLGAGLFFFGTSVAAMILGVSISKYSKGAPIIEAGVYFPTGFTSEDIFLLISAISLSITFIIMFLWVGRASRQKKLNEIRTGR